MNMFEKPEDYKNALKVVKDIKILNLQAEIDKLENELNMMDLTQDNPKIKEWADNRKSLINEKKSFIESLKN